MASHLASHWNRGLGQWEIAYWETPSFNPSSQSLSQIAFLVKFEINQGWIITY